MFKRQPQPRRTSDGAVLRAGINHALRLVLAILPAACGGCAPVGNADAPASAPATASLDDGGIGQSVGQSTSPESSRDAETSPRLTVDNLPVLGSDAPIAARGFDARARQSSKSPKILMDEFEQHFAAGRFAEALSTLETALRDRPEDTTLLYLIAVTHRAAGHSNQAVPTLERVIAIDPHNVPARKLLCIVWTESGRCTEAEAQMDALVAAGTSDAEAWALRGAARLRCGNLAGASTDADQSLAIDPGLHHALLLRCAVRMRQGQLAEAHDDLTAARKAGAPESHWQTLSEQLTRRLAEQQQSSGADPTH